MRILISGAGGLVGSALVPRLEADGHEIVRLVRRPPRNDGEVTWDPDGAPFDATGAAGCEAVVHLAGENIAGGRWTRGRMQRIRTSRVDGTAALVEGLGKLDTPPRIWVGASAIGFYGDRGDEELDEDSPIGGGFLAGVCQEWEAASAGVTAWQARHVLLRIGIVLDPAGGALGKMLPFFRLGLGGVLGSGRQYMSWIALDDLVEVFVRALNDDRLSGVYNACSPNPVTNREFTQTLGSVLHRPTILPAPAFGLRLVYGRMADAALLASQRVLPRRLRELDHEFGWPKLGPALEHVLRDRGTASGG